jgi:hypothetical protein
MKELNKISEIDWARLAAYIDGEGTIRIDVQKASPGNGGYSRHLLEVRVYNCDPRLIVWCKQTFGGGNVKPVRKANPKPTWKKELVWYVGGKEAEAILLGCFPYFIIKQKHAHVALAFRQLIGKTGQKVLAKNLEKREKLRKDLVLVNWKGITTELVQ